MTVTYMVRINAKKEHRKEFILLNWDYIDGGDYLAKIFSKEFGMAVEERIDYIYFSVIKLHLGETAYELLWHEDFGNMIYSLQNDIESVNELEERLKIVLNILNEKLKEVT